MRDISKAMLRTIGGLAVAGALVAGGAGVASAAPVSPTAHTTHSSHPFAREQWNLSGRNKVEALYKGSTFTYRVTFRQFGDRLFGMLTDPYYPTTGPVFGRVFGNHVRFSFRYPSGSTQGTRTYIGTINRRGAVSGTWSDSGSDRASGTFTLTGPAHRVHRHDRVQRF